jgi:hypothetical protein
MFMPPATQMQLKDNFREIARVYRPIVLVNVTVTQSNYDSFTDSALNTPDETSGTGLIPAFTVVRVNARWVVIDFPAINPYEGIPPGLESGDYIIWTSPRDYAVMLASQDSAYSYLELSGQTFKLQGVNPDGMGMTGEYRWLARKHKPVFARPK